MRGEYLGVGEEIEEDSVVIFIGCFFHHAKRTNVIFAVIIAGGETVQMHQSGLDSFFKVVLESKIAWLLLR